MAKEQVSIKGFDDSMTLESDSYASFAFDKDGNLDVVFYTPSQFKENDDFDKLDFYGFSEIVYPYDILQSIVERGGIVNYDSVEGLDSADASLVKGDGISMDDVDVVIVEIHQDISSMLVDGKLNTEALLKRLNRKADEFRASALEAHAESVELTKDPYSYYGLKRSDF